MREVTVTDKNNNIIAKIFVDEDGSVKAIVKDDYYVYVDGNKLEKEDI